MEIAMTRYTIEERDHLKDYAEKYKKARHELGPNFPILDADEGLESTLQKKIVQWARDWGHPCLSFRQSKKLKGQVPEGWPDITMLLNNKVLFLELKSSKGRLSESQKMMRLQFLNHKFIIHEVRSYRHFLELVEE
jgi:hypothetical protein